MTEVASCCWPGGTTPPDPPEGRPTGILVSSSALPVAPSAVSAAIRSISSVLSVSTGPSWPWNTPMTRASASVVVGADWLVSKVTVILLIVGHWPVFQPGSGGGLLCPPQTAPRLRTNRDLGSFCQVACLFPAKGESGEKAVKRGRDRVRGPRPRVAPLPVVPVRATFPDSPNTTTACISATPCGWSTARHCVPAAACTGAHDRNNTPGSPEEPSRARRVARAGDGIVYQAREHQDSWLMVGYGLQYYLARDMPNGVPVPHELFIARTAAEASTLYPEPCKQPAACLGAERRIWVIGVGRQKSPYQAVTPAQAAGLRPRYRLAPA